MKNLSVTQIHTLLFPGIYHVAVFSHMRTIIYM